MDVYKLLHDDHLKVETIFKALEAAPEGAVWIREELFARLEVELLLHADAEERFFYPRLWFPSETHELTLEAMEEHQVVKTLLSELGEVDKGTEEWAAKCAVLRDIVDHHVRKEEERLFRKAENVLSREDAESIVGEIEMFKEVHSRLAPGG
jgi:hypothetical protein